jgi:DNA mismatch repair protein MutS
MKSKRKYPDACLLFRVGDFTKHSEKMSGLQKYWDNTDQAWCGFCNRDRIGWFSTSFYKHLFAKISEGGTVAICDQLEDPKMTKNIVKRGVTELVTPSIYE